MKKPSGLLLALGLGKPGSKKPMKEEDESVEMDSESDDSGFASAAADLFDALKAGDRVAFKLALKAAIEECSYEDDDE